jgi:hypothetical protein
MELKDVILSTLAEMEEGTADTPQPVGQKAENPFERVETDETSPIQASHSTGMSTEELLEDECRYLESVKERLLVLFEGFQSPNNTHIEAKVDLTLNFLEYLLATIDGRIENIKKSGR